MSARGAGPAAIARALVAYQLLAARDAVDSVPLMLEEQNIDPDPVAAVAPTALIGVASDGRSLEGLFSQASSDTALGLMVVTQLQDVARMAAGVAMTNSRGADGYVRMLSTPSCSRCVILAGKFFRWNDGFQRHPRCDCRHIPSRENVAGDLTTNPDEYFGSLSAAEQDKAFTKAGAQAIRDGADMGQVVNARRGMSTAQIDVTGASRGRLQRRQLPAFYGNQSEFISTEGTTRRGRAYQSLNERFTRPESERRAKGERYFRTTNVRLMPESIYELAKDRDDAIRLLRLHGYIF